MATVEELQDQIAALEATLSGTTGMVGAFEGELSRMRETMVFTGREVNVLSSGIGGGLRRAFDGLVFDGAKLSDALKSVAKSLGRYGLRHRDAAGAERFGRGDCLGPEWPVGWDHAVRKGRQLFPRPGDAVRQGRRRLTSHPVCDARRAGLDGRSGARGDHAAGARRGWAAWGADARAAGAR